METLKKKWNCLFTQLLGLVNISKIKIQIFFLSVWLLDDGWCHWYTRTTITTVEFLYFYTQWKLFTLSDVKSLFHFNPAEFRIFLKTYIYLSIHIRWYTSYDMEKQIDWIEYSNCKRLVHQNCLENPSAEANFECLMW